MTMASVHVETGNTAMFSLPRNLQHVRFPPSTALGKRFPNGFMRELPNGGLLNEVSGSTPRTTRADARSQERAAGPRALMDAVGYTLNLKIDYYALVNMFGFAHLVDAIGGLKIRVERDVRGAASTAPPGPSRPDTGSSPARRLSGTGAPASAATTSPGWPPALRHRRLRPAGHPFGRAHQLRQDRGRGQEDGQDRHPPRAAGAHHRAGG
ncbi:LCP family protein [Streptosporangium vulgare]|uniref:LCP family glycopolymer transferase n=1 Tax=Streptosporangium vulgare TaxID=46190 RepID=UPI0031E3CB54